MNCNTQNAKIKSITEKTLIVGIDVGSETHYARAFDWRNIEFSKKPFAFSNDEAGFASFKAWLEDIKEKFGKTIVLPGMEPTGHYWFNLGAFLQDNGMKPVHVNPHHVHKSKELDDNNPSKDPKTIAALVNEGRFNYPYIPTGVYAEIRSLYGLQVMTQEALIRVKNRIARWLSIYFPEYKDVYRSCDAISGVMVLKVCPLGRLFAYAPKTADGHYPCEAVCQIIEEYGDESLLSEYRCELFNKRGIFSPSAGRAEKDIAEGYKDNAEFLSIKYPKTADVFFKMSQRYVYDSDLERRRAENGYF